jgi:hypothetical protein
MSNVEFMRAGRLFVEVPMVLLILNSMGSSQAYPQGIGYAVAGPAVRTGFFGSAADAVHFAGGGELLVKQRIGIGGELGLLGGSNALRVISLNGAFHFTRLAKSRTLEPFPTSGYTRMGSGEGSFSAWNIGAGADYWVSERIGIRLEVRDHVRPDPRGTAQYWSIRGGIVFR